jgi:KUP system potassium uptake protein
VKRCTPTWATFGKKPIRVAWFAIVMPALTLNYFGQGALLLQNPEAVKNPFFMMAPDWALLPLVGIGHHGHSDCIAGPDFRRVFSVTKQVMQLGYLPRLQLLHTSVRDRADLHSLRQLGPVRDHRAGRGHVQVEQQPGSGLRHCRVHRHADHHVLTFFVIRYGWKYPLWLCISATGFFFVVDLAFWASNLLKLFDGGWFPLVIGGASSC